MPTVRRYGGRQVATEALSGVRKSAAETPTSTGADLAQAQGEQARAIGRLGQTVTQIGLQRVAEQEEEARKGRELADHLAVREADTTLGKWENDRLWNQTNGAYTRKGQDAMPLPAEVGGEFTELASAIEAKLNPRQREMFQSVRARRGLDLHANLQQHVGREMQRYEVETLQATEENASESAAVNATSERRVGEELTRGLAAINGSAKRLGLTGEVLDKRRNDFTTRTYVGVIDKLVADGNVAKARIYFEEAKEAGQITGAAALAHLTTTLKIGDERVQAQTVSDGIIAEGGSLAEQKAKVREKLTGDARDRALQYVEHEDAARKQAKREGEETLLDTVMARLKQNGGNLRSVTPAEEQALGSHLPGILSFADRLAKGEPVKSDKAILYTMLDHAEKQPANFKDLNLRPLLGKLDEQDYDRLDRVQRAMRAGDQKAADKELDDFRSESGVIANALTLAGLDASPKDSDTAGKERLAQFHGLVAAEARRVQDITGKKLQNTDLEAIANRLLAHQIQHVDQGWIWNTTTTKSLATATVDDIPATDRTQIEESLKRHGQPVTPAAALAIWLKAQARKAGP
jgi:hypothetical protein